MGYFDFLSPDLQDQQTQGDNVPDDEATNLRKHVMERNADVIKTGQDVIDSSIKQLDPVNRSLDSLIELDNQTQDRSGLGPQVTNPAHDAAADEDVYKNVISKLPPQERQAAIDKYFSMVRQDTGLGPDISGNIDATLKATGRDPKTMRMSFVAVAKKLEEKHGIDTDNLKDQVPFSHALPTILNLIDPGGNILQQLANDLQAGSQQPEQQKTKTTTGDVQTTDTAKEDLYTQNIRNMQAQRRRLYAQLGQMPELQNWFGVIAFVLLSIATRSPSVAAGVLGIAARQGNLKSQLDLIEKEMHEEANFLRATQKRTDMQRKMAADQALHKQDKSETFQMQLYRDYLNDRNLRSRMMERAKSDPQHAGAYKAMHDSMSTFTHDAGVVHGEIVAQDKIINDYLSTPAMKRDAQNKKIPLVKKFDDLQERRKNLRIEMEKYAGVPSPEPEPVGNE